MSAPVQPGASAGVGPPVDRVDGPVKVTGRARYTGDIALPGLAHAVMLQSSIGKGEITAMDTAAALALPGVIAILTPYNAPRLPADGKAAYTPPAGHALALLQDRAVHYNGQPIGVIVAETLEQATHAAAVVSVRYATESPRAEMDPVLTSAYPYQYKIVGFEPPVLSKGDVESGLLQGDARVDAVYRTPLETHNPMEPHATTAQWNGEQLTLYDATQFVYGVRAFVSTTLGLPPEHVRVVSHFAGGAFGGKGSAWSHVVLAAMAARQVGRPVRLVLTRRQLFGPVGGRPFTVQHVSVAARTDGTLTGIRHDSTSSTSEVEDWVEPCALATRILYECPNVHTSHSLVQLNSGTPTFMRAPGESSGTFALESAMDELAVSLGMDPLALRLKNYAEQDPETGKPWSSKALRQCYAMAADRFGWSRRSAAPRSMRDGQDLVGWGMATATYPALRLPASALVRLMPDGRAIVRAATHELGTGTYTVQTQLAAETLGIPIDMVTFELGDTDFPPNPISAGSFGTASTGSAVYEACVQARSQLDAARRSSQPIEVRVDSRPSDESRRYATHAFGAVFAAVRVDQSMGYARVERVVAAYGGGRVLNEKTARSQLVGGIIFGIGMALTEESTLDPRTARYVNADLADYLVPVNADVPVIDILFADEPDTVINPIGIKGLGEIGNTGVAAAIANAVYHATGVRVRDLPITLDKVMAL
jgi:xanthine dehydrogenase YagR molybdenum-binding subunit